MFTNNLIAGAAGNQGGSFYPFPIDQSLRFNDDDSAYLSRTPASTTNRKTWTWSGWVKRGNLVGGMLFSAGLVSGTYYYHVISFSGNDRLNFNYYPDGSASAGWLSTARLFRDPSAWYHIHAVWDTTQATSTDRMRLYVNGVQETVFVTETFSERYPAQNTDGLINNSSYQHRIGQHVPGSGNSLFDGYMAEINFIDGQALEPTEFGEFKSGVWVAKEYTGSYGTNGFHLTFADSGAIGDDTSGNTNDWTANNLAATDVLPDSTTNNFATMNPLASNRYDYPIANNIAEGNLKVSYSPNAYGGIGSTIAVPKSGKWYIECCAASVAGAGLNSAFNLQTYDNNNNYGYDTPYTGSGIIIKRTDGVTTSNTSVGAASAGDILSILIDADARTAQIKRNNVDVWTPYTMTSNDVDYFITYQGYGHSGAGFIYNFGQDSSFAGNKTAQGNTDANGVGDFYYAPPSDYLALAASNLPNLTIDPAQDDVPSDYFNTVLWTGDGTSSRSITGVGFQPSFLWTKNRSTPFTGATSSHYLSDSVRGSGTAALKILITNSTGAEVDGNSLGVYGGVSSLDADGFTVTTGTDGNENRNSSGVTYVAWNWLAGNGTSSNTSGSISTTVSANPKAGFSIISWTGNDTAGATIGHGLNSAPEMFITFRRNVGDNHPVYHSALGGTKAIHINLTDTPYTSSGYWNDTNPTSSVITLGSDSSLNWSAYNYVGYAFHSVEGYSSFGQYTGNGSADGPFIFCGFEPAVILLKSSSVTGGWEILDNARDPYNVAQKLLQPNVSNAEASSANHAVDFLSNGFKIRTSGGSDPAINTNGSTVIYAAWAFNPFKYATAR